MGAGRWDGPEAAAWRRAGRAAAGAAPAPGGCPDDAALAALAAGELAGEGRRRVADHVVACPACAASFRLLREIDAEAAPALGRRGGGWGSRRGRWAAGLAAAAAVGVLAVATLIERPAAVPGPSTLRGPAAAELALDPPHGAGLAVPPASLSWPRQAGEPPYRVWVYDGEAAPLWTSPPVEGIRVELPPELRRRLAAGGTFYWRVRTEHGPASRSTPLARFEIAR